MRMILISPRRFYHVKSARVKNFYKLLQFEAAQGGVSTYIERFSFEASTHLYHFRNTPKKARYCAEVQNLGKCKILVVARLIISGKPWRVKIKFFDLNSVPNYYTISILAGKQRQRKSPSRFSSKKILIPT